MEKITARVERMRRVQIELASKTRPAIITLVRDPVARAVSCYFHHLTRHQPAVSLTEPPTARWLERTKTDIVKNDERFFAAPEVWMQNELLSTFDFPVYEQAFPCARGYAIYAGACADLLVLRVEDLDAVAAEAMHEFLGLRAFSLRGDNRAAQKPYHCLYAHFLAEVSFSDGYLEQTYKDKVVQQFYETAERRRLRNRWMRISR